MRANTLRDALAAGEVAVGAWLSVGSPYLAEVLSHCGYDCVTVDVQHGMFDLGAAVTLLQAVGSGPAIPLARCLSKDAAAIGKLLDAGAYGIICPGIDSAEDAEAFVRACRYPPRGTRSFGPARALLYAGTDYPAHADDAILTWAMIESAEALADLDRILAVPGLDGVYVGPNDLALSLGESPAQPTLPPAVCSALERIARSAHDAGRWAGTFCADAVVARQMVELGYRFVTPGNDVATIRGAATERIAVVRGERADTAEAGGY